MSKLKAIMDIPMTKTEIEREIFNLNVIIPNSEGTLRLDRENRKISLLKKLELFNNPQDEIVVDLSDDMTDEKADMLAAMHWYREKAEYDYAIL